MRNSLLFCLTVSISLVANASDRVIELVDGSRIRGEIVSMDADTWVIRSDTLGIIEIDGNRIQSIAAPGSSAAPSAPDEAPKGEALGAIESTIASDTGLMARIRSLRDDPQVQAVLSDPEVMAAVRSLDFEALRNHPKFRALMNDPEMKEITAELH